MMRVSHQRLEISRGGHGEKAESALFYNVRSPAMHRTPLKGPLSEPHAVAKSYPSPMEWGGWRGFAAPSGGTSRLAPCPGAGVNRVSLLRLRGGITQSLQTSFVAGKPSQVENPPPAVTARVSTSFLCF